MPSSSQNRLVHEISFGQKGWNHERFWFKQKSEFARRHRRSVGTLPPIFVVPHCVSGMRFWMTKGNPPVERAVQLDEVHCGAISALDRNAFEWNIRCERL